MKPLEEMDIRKDILYTGVSGGDRYLTDVVFHGGWPDKIIETYDRILEEDVEKFLRILCDTRMDGIMVAPIGCYSPEALSMIKRYEPKIQLYRTGLEGKSC